ncbi:MAG: protein kinase [Candidatus Sumerlaeaceae bacterium]|nr:protein kinase [Candidatus Sumerlaeaceae bacterium]
MPDSSPLNDFPSDTHASWRPEPGPEISEAFERYLKETSAYPERGTALPEGVPVPGSGSDSTASPRHAAYLLRRVVAEGGHGEVWQAVQVSLNRVVAVKKVRKKWYDEKAQNAARMLELAFHREALVTGRLDHPTIVPIYDMGADQQGRPLLAMKLVEGTEWTDLIAEDRHLDRAAFFARHLPILISVAQAVAFAHSRGVIHRDLKPSQVMVGKYGEVYLMDWGLAAIFEDQAAPLPDSATLPFSVHVKDAINPAGTMCFMAPEQTENSGIRLGPWTDVFLLGGTLYELLTDTPPHNDATSREAFESARRCQIPAPEVRAPGLEIPGELSRIAMTALQAEIGDRYASVMEFVQALQDYLHGTGRRRESVELTERVRGMLGGGVSVGGQSTSADASGSVSAGEPPALPAAASSVDYQALSECDNLLTSALNLWPENPDAGDLQQDLLDRFAEASIANSDLGLARSQVVRLSNESRRAELGQQIEAKAAEIRKLARQRQLAITSSFGLIIVLGLFAALLISLLANWRIEKQQAEQAQAVAEIDAKDAEEESRRTQERTARTDKTSSLYRDEAQLARELEEEWRPQLILPPTLSLGAYDEQVLAGKDPARLDELDRRIDSVRAQRSILDDGTLAPPPSRLALAAGYMALFRSAHGGGLKRASLFLGEAARFGLDKDLAWVGLSAAATQLGNFDAAAKGIEEAADFAQRVRSERDYRKTLMLAYEIQLARYADFHFGPEDILIEPRDPNRKQGRYWDNKDVWTDAGAPWEHAKSAAPGTARVPGWGARLVRFFAVSGDANTTLPALARYEPMLNSRRHLYVYATYPFSANAAPVIYTIYHASGETSRSLAQDGWAGAWRGGANQWTMLGDYDFAPGERQGLEIRANPGITFVRPINNGQVVADAVVFSSKPLAVATTLPLEFRPPEGQIVWQGEPAKAIAQALHQNKRVLWYISASDSKHRIYSFQKVFPRKDIVDAVNSNFVPLMSSMEPPTARDHGLSPMPDGTIVLCSPTADGSGVIIQKPIKPEKGLIPEVLFKELAQ